MSKVIMMEALVDFPPKEVLDVRYLSKVLTMSKVELLEEMVRFQEERAEAGKLTSKLIIEGQILFKALEETAESCTLKELARSYRRHLKYEQLSRLKCH
jgi:hypothetical protein